MRLGRGVDGGCGGEDGGLEEHVAVEGADGDLYRVGLS